MKRNHLLIRGRLPLSGRVEISGAKNAALPGLAATLLTSKPCFLENTPRVDDIHNLLLTMKEVGAEYSFTGNKLRLQTQKIIADGISPHMARTTRASILLLGPMLARHGTAVIPFPGGCSIGERKIDFHLQGLEKMGVQFHIDGEIISGRCNQLKGIEYTFPAKTVTGTENLLMAASLAEGVSILRNCALEPEISDLSHMLSSMGASIQGIGSDTLVIEGKSSLNGLRHRIISDRIEAGTFLIAAAFEGNDVEIDNVDLLHLESLLNILKKAGFFPEQSKAGLRLIRKNPLRPVNLATEPYPGFPTDLQAQLTTLLTQVPGTSTIQETIFNDRFKHTGELNRMGADISISGNKAVIHGKTHLHGTLLTTTDLRASAALVLAGLIAEGETVIQNATMLFRGYESMPEKLQKLGANIKIT